MEFKSETSLLLSGLTVSTALIIGIKFNTPVLAGVLALTSFLAFRFAEKNSLRKSQTSADRVLLSLTQRLIEAIIIVTVLLQPNISRIAGLTVLLTVFIVETTRDELENIAKAEIKPYVGFEVRSLILISGLLIQGLAEYGAFYAGALVILLNIYEFSRTLRISF